MKKKNEDIKINVSLYFVDFSTIYPHNQKTHPFLPEKRRLNNLLLVLIQRIYLCDGNERYDVCYLYRFRIYSINQRYFPQKFIIPMWNILLYVKIPPILENIFCYIIFMHFENRIIFKCWEKIIYARLW